MKRMISIWGAAALLAGALLAPAAARAEDKTEKPAMTEEGKHGKGLGLSEEQEGKLKTLRRAHREAQETAHSQMEATMRKLRDQLEDKVPEKELSATLDKLQAARKEMWAQQEKFEADLSAVLTPTQRAKMAVGMMMRGPHGRGGGHGMRGRGGEGHGEGRGEGDGDREPDGPKHDED